MTATKKIPTISHTIGKAISVMVMMFGLLFLTGSNFLIYPANQQEQMICQQDSQEAPSPVEEKSKSSNGSVNVQEEYLHERHSLKELAWLDDLLRHRIMDAEKLEIVHYELISPPPKG